MAHDNHAHDHGTGGESHGSVKSYLIGFVLAVVLTVIPFWMVMSGDFSRTVNGVVIAVTAVLQMLVHLVFFLHLDRSSESRWRQRCGLHHRGDRHHRGRHPVGHAQHERAHDALTSWRRCHAERPPSGGLFVGGWRAARATHARG